MYCYILDPTDPTKTLLSVCDPKIKDNFMISDSDILAHSIQANYRDSNLNIKEFRQLVLKFPIDDMLINTKRCAKVCYTFVDENGDKCVKFAIKKDTRECKLYA